MIKAAWVPLAPLRPWVATAVAALVGAWLAWYLYGGLIDPREVEWLIYENDPLQHYIGWHYFRRDEWQWPLGAMTNLASDIGASIVFTDSIPLLALPLKLFHHWLPDPFQYLGLVLLVNLLLNGAVACALLQRGGMTPWPALLGSILFVSLPMATMRGVGAHGHEALSAHWLILLAVWLLLFYRQMTLGTASRWLLLLAVAAAVHFYLFFMVGVLWSGWWLRAAWPIRFSSGTHRTLFVLGVGLATPVMIVLWMWALGYFHYGADGGGGGGYGVFSAELLTYLNPRSEAWFLQADDRLTLSAVLPGWSTPVWGQYEGQAYAGLGALLLLAMAFGMAVDRGWRPLWAMLPMGMCWMLLLMLGMFVFALSDKVVIGYRVFELGYGRWLAPLTDLLRSSGRLAWPLLYGLLALSLWLIARTWSVRRQTVALCLLVVVQWLDLKGWHASVHHRLEARLEQTRNEPLPYAVLNAEELAPLWRSRTRFVALPVEEIAVLRPYTWLAAEHDMKINVAHLARITPESIAIAIASDQHSIMAGELDADAVYVLTDTHWAEIACRIANVQCREIENVTLAWLNEIPDEIREQE